MLKQQFKYRLPLIALGIFTSQTVGGAQLDLHNTPLFLSSGERANVLVVLDNSNSMDEAANGSAVGGASPDSKSEISRTAVKNLISNYTNKINMGLMAYQQSSIISRHLHNSPYDASFDSSNYDPSFTGSRDSATKRFRTPNLSNPGEYIYYNVALPFYSPSNQGSRYCYSVTADFDNGAETITGPWDVYRCFSNKTSSTDTLPIWRNKTSETAAGFTDYNFQSQLSPTDSDFAQNLLDFGSYLTWDWVSKSWFANSSPGRGYLHTPISKLDSTQAGKLNTKLGTSQFTTNGPTNSSLPLQNAGLTPIEGTLLTAKNYFSGVALSAEEGGPAAALPESCGKDFITLLTDGLPSTTATGTTTTDTAAALASVTTVAGDLNTNGVETYTIGFALPVGTDPTALDTIAAAGGTGTAYMANDPTTLQATFDTIFSDILAKSGAASSAATNTSTLSDNSFVYKAGFNSSDWRGALGAYAINTLPSGKITVNANYTWEANDKLNSVAETDRAIITFGRDTKDGIPFRWSDINALTDTVAKTALNMDPLTLTYDGLGADRVNFLRGGTGGSSSALFRTDRNGKLGDIVHSSPFYLGPPRAGYPGTSYGTFFTNNASRAPMIYVGANDGMLHAFDTSGNEKLAYVPKKVYSNLSRLTAQGYGTTLSHEFMVDGSPMIADAFYSGNWKTVLAAGLNGGGQGIYALDVTTPASFSEADAANIVLWEFTDEDDADLGYTYMDPTINRLTNQSAQIAKMANGKWAVIFGNGYNNTEADGFASTTGRAYLYIAFIEGGLDGTWTIDTDYIKIDTGKGSFATPNGLATPTPQDLNGDGVIDVIYAGDLLGNLWKFDVTNSSPSNWGITISGNKPLFTAKDSGGTPQPITSAPLFAFHPSGGFIISFGTGKYLGLTDVPSTATQSIYGVRDLNTNISSRTKLVEQTVISVVHVADTSVTPSVINDFRITSDNDVDYSDKDGWFMDLPESGERVDVNPIARDGEFVYATRTPSTVACTAGGSSWILDLNYLTGGRLEGRSPVDVNNDGLINEDDYQEITITNADGSISTELVQVSGYSSGDSGMYSSPSMANTQNGRNSVALHSSSNYKGGEQQTSSVPGCTLDCPVPPPVCENCTKLHSKQAATTGRISWEQIR